MWSRIKKALVSKPANALAGFFGATAELLEGAVFVGVAANKLLIDLFAPLGGAATAATVVSLPSTLLSEEKSTKDKAMSLLACGPTAALFYAIFLAEAASAPLIFAYVIGTSWGIETLDLLLKKYYGEKIPTAEMDEYVRKTAKKVSILTVLINADGSGAGANLDAAKEGKGTLLPRLCSGAAGALAVYGSGKGFYETGKHLFAANESMLTSDVASTPRSSVSRDIETGHADNEDILGEAYHRMVNP